jgi:pimeloyl-ACP methyl ester carboxylesterase
MTLPVRLPHDLRFHREPFIDYQLQRAHALGTLPADIARRGAARVRRLHDVPAVFGALADDAERGGRWAEAAGCARVAEFFTARPSDAQVAAYERYNRAWERAFGAGTERHSVPYGDGALPAYRRPARGERRGVLLAFGGFDSIVQEFDPIWRGLADAGFDVIAFDGPGQGGARTLHGLPHTHDWERPVAAVLDHFGVTRATLVGMSMGGYWAIRAAAFEPRIVAVVSWSPVFDWLARLPRPMAAIVRRMVTWRAFMNGTIRARMRLFPILRHVVTQATWMTRTDEPIDAVDWLLGMHASHVASERVRVPTLLVVGERDRFQPPVLGDLQARALVHAPVTLRRFTVAEGAAGHCQLGNLPLAIAEVGDWLKRHAGHAASPRGRAAERAA